MVPHSLNIMGRRSSNQKIFCIGLNKTGTTTLKVTLQNHGFKVGDEGEAYTLVDDYKRRDFHGLIQYCKKNEAFQDAPFSWWHTFVVMDQAFPRSKFILTERNSPEEWYDSLLRFHSNLYNAGNLPTPDVLAQIQRPGGRTALQNMTEVFGVPEDDPYNKEVLIDYYLKHNQQVRDYFRHKGNLLILNLKEERGYFRFCDFVGIQPIWSDFPKANQSDEVGKTKKVKKNAGVNGFTGKGISAQEASKDAFFKNRFLYLSKAVLGDRMTERVKTMVKKNLPKL